MIDTEDPFFNLPPFEFDQAGNGIRLEIPKLDFIQYGWRRLQGALTKNSALRKYLDKYTVGFKWNNPPSSTEFVLENQKMYPNPYIVYVHLFQMSQGVNNISYALKGMLFNELDDLCKILDEALLLFFEDKQEAFNDLCFRYENLIKEGISSNGMHPFFALKLMQENFSDKVSGFNRVKSHCFGAAYYCLE